MPAAEYTRLLESLLEEIQPGAQNMANDSDVQRLETYLEKAKSRINSLFYNAPFAYCVLVKPGIIVTANNAFCSLFHLKHDEPEGRLFSDFIHPESQELLEFQIKKIFDSKTTLSTNLTYSIGEKQGFIRFQTTYYNEIDTEFLQCIVTDITNEKAIEEELEASEAQFRTLLEASPVGILVLYKGKYIYSNQAGASIFGYGSPDDMIDLTAINTVTEEFRPLMSERIKRLEGNLTNTPIEVMVLCRDGSKKTCESVSIPVIYNNRLSALILIKDISERKADEILIRESEKKYKEMYQMLRLMCDNVPDMIWAKDLNDKYIFANKALSNDLLNALDTDEPVGKTDTFFSERQKAQHPENPDWHTFGKLSKDESDENNDVNRKQRFNISGNVQGKLLNLEINKAPFTDSEGRVIGSVGSGRDVTHETWLQTENMKMVDEVTYQKSRLNAVVNVLPDLLFIVNLEGRFLDFFANQPEKLFVAPGNIKNAQLSDIFSQEETIRQLTIYRQCIEEKRVTAFEYQIQTEEGTQYYEARIAPLSSDSILAIVRDISEKKRIELKLKENNTALVEAKNKAEESDRLKSAFLANMSHEIRTPMNSIIGFANLLRESGIDEEKKEQYTGIIIKRSGDLLRLINDLLDVSSIESGITTIYNSETDLNQLLDKIYSGIISKPLFGISDELKLICEKAMPGRPMLCLTDGLKLQQIFTHLLDNALKFTQKGIVKFGYKEPSDGKLICYVSDTGVGISPEYHSVIFERFRQADIHNAKLHSGTGLGLAISKGYTEMMGGKIWVESNPGEGSTFYFEIPFVKPTKNDPHYNNLPEQLKTYDWSSKNIILVEDDEQNVKYLRTILNRTGANIYVCANSITLREILGTIDSIHLILMDIQLPGENGWQLTRYIKALNPAIPVIAQTAYGMESDRRRSMESGCDDFIAKPIMPLDLLNLIAKFLGN